MKVEVAYALPNEQVIIPVEVAQGATVQEAIELSGIIQRYPQIDLSTAAIGLFSKKTQLDAMVRAGDRVEIYRPLLIDPKQARLLRARKKSQS